MDDLTPYLNKRTMIVGDVNTGKTAKTLKILKRFITEGYAEKIAVLDMGTGPVRGIGGKMLPPAEAPVFYLTGSISAPRLMGKDARDSLRLARENARSIDNLFVKLIHVNKEILFVNDATLYLQAGDFERFMAILDTFSTQVINAYYGKTFPESDLTRREKRLTEDLIKTCDNLLEMFPPQP